MSVKNERRTSSKYCLCFNLDTGLAYKESMDVKPAEKVAVGNYCSSVIGTEAYIEGLIKKITRRPYLIEKYIKIY
ncbi:hypothetical protein BC643_0390 [Mangrovibacterium diazotrophicum]|uniref:Uncharacterized protein n=1 Tax=Mangrovibacterium diazotrophicum TaxID=1261403 RepID=A0A419W3P2_9BACT|nr:hypothetical protein BC643_0390 [Mangrovibacterium diazotrophicum]